MKSLHYNNSVKSKQKLSDVGNEMIRAILESGEREIILSVDDGDGDVWKYYLSVSSDKIDPIIQLNEN